MEGNPLYPLSQARNFQTLPVWLPTCPSTPSIQIPSQSHACQNTITRRSNPATKRTEIIKIKTDIRNFYNCLPNPGNTSKKHDKKTPCAAVQTSPLLHLVALGSTKTSHLSFPQQTCHSDLLSSPTDVPEDVGNVPRGIDCVNGPSYYTSIRWIFFLVV